MKTEKQQRTNFSTSFETDVNKMVFRSPGGNNASVNLLRKVSLLQFFTRQETSCNAGISLRSKFSTKQVIENDNEIALIQWGLRIIFEFEKLAVFFEVWDFPASLFRRNFSGVICFKFVKFFNPKLKENLVGWTTMPKTCFPRAPTASREDRSSRFVSSQGLHGWHKMAFSEVAWGLPYLYSNSSPT